MEPLSVSVLRYGPRIMQGAGGPISGIRSRMIKIAGAQYWEAFVDLAPQFRKLPYSNTQLNGRTSGSGTGPNRRAAISKAISEALERWAYFETLEPGENQSRYGYALDRSTTGMAAFPGLNARSARYFAKAEAIERYMVSRWWLGLEQAYQLEPDTLVLKSRVGGYFVAIHLIRTPQNGWILGYGKSRSLSSAIGHSAIEASRTRYNWDRFSNEVTSGRQLNPHEAQIHFCCTGGLNSELNDRINAAALYEGQAFSIREISSFTVDTEIKGRWSTYAPVWRCLLAGDPSAKLWGQADAIPL